MPHVIVKMQSGRTEQQKAKVAEAVAKAIMSSLGSPDEAVSVAIEDVAASDWRKAVVEPDILAKPKTIFKQPGYRT